MRLSDIMSEAVETIPAAAPPEQARELMRRHDVRHLVVTEGGAVAGVLSQHDLEDAQGVSTVRAIMSAPVVTAGPRTTLRQAANLMRGNGVGCLPVLDEEGRTVGIVTASDLLDVIGKGVTRGSHVSHHWEEKHRGRRKPPYVPGR
jgi:acetoin utilization protein AcuB